MKTTLFVRRLLPLVITLLVLVACTSGVEEPASDTEALSTQVNNVVGRTIYASSDDAEEFPNGTIWLGNSDLELGYDGQDQMALGLHFYNIEIPKGATITEATIQFTADEATSMRAKIGLRGLAYDDPGTFTKSSKIASAPATSERMLWEIEPWDTVGERGPKQKTPNFANVVQEIVDRPGWKSGNSMAFRMKDGLGTRVAVARDAAASSSGSDGTPALAIKWMMTPSAAYTQGADGLVQIEAEDNQANVAKNGASWELVSTDTAQGGQSLEASPDSGITRDTDYVANSPRLDFTVDFNRAGTHYVRVRGSAYDANDDSVHVGLNGNAVSSAEGITGFSQSYGWSQNTSDGAVATINVPSAGVHTVNVWMHEDGFDFDALELSPNQFGETTRSTTCSPSNYDNVETLEARNYAGDRPGKTYKPHRDNPGWEKVSDNTLIDATAASFVDPDPARVNKPDQYRFQYQSVHIEDLDNVCLSGGYYDMGLPDDLNQNDLGNIDSDERYSAFEFFHLNPNIGVFNSPNSIIKGIAVKITSKGVTYKEGSSNWVLRHSYFRHTGSNPVENDWMYDGVIDNVLFDWVYSGISCRMDGDSQAAFDRGEIEAGTITVENTLMALRPQYATWDPDDSPDFISFFKWQEEEEKDDITDSGCTLNIKNNVFYTSDENSLANSFAFEDITNEINECENNLVVYTGDGSMNIPAKFADCFTVTTDESRWTNARNNWFNDHPEFERFRDDEPTDAPNG